MRVIAVIAALTAALVPLGPARAADTVTATSRVSIEHGRARDVFKGRVRAREYTGYVEPGCRRARQVVVKRRKPGPDKVVNRDLTNRRGRYYMPNLLKRKKWHRGRFYARVVRKRIPSENDPDGVLVCKPARSRIIRVR